MFRESFDFNRVCSSVTDLQVTGWERLSQPNPTSSPLSQEHLRINPNCVAAGFDVGNEKCADLSVIWEQLLLLLYITQARGTLGKTMVAGFGLYLVNLLADAG